MKSLSTAVILMCAVVWGSPRLSVAMAGGNQQVSSPRDGRDDCGGAVVMYGNCNCSCCYNTFLNGDAIIVNCAQANSNTGTVNVLGVLVPLTSDECGGGCSSGTQCALVLLNVGDPDTSGDVPTAKKECCTSTNGTNVLNCPSDSQCNEQRYSEDSSRNFCCSDNRSNCAGKSVTLPM